MNLYLRELKAHRKSILIWSVCMALLVFMGVAKYKAGVATGTESFNQMMKELPQSLQNMLGVGIFDLSKLVDYFGILYIYLALIVTIHAVMTGNGIIAKEERDKTAEFLLVKPISRKKIVTAKLFAGLTQIVILNIITSMSSIAVFAQNSIGEDYAVPVMKLMAGLFGMQLVALALGALIAAACGKYRKTSSIATGIIIMMFLLSVIIDITSKVEFLRVFTIFKYFDPKDILKLGYNLAYLIIAGLVTAIFVYGTYYFYGKRDIRI